MARNETPWATFTMLMVWVCHHSNLCGGLWKHSIQEVSTGQTWNL